ncbi:extracellular solute-binding protein [Cohnella xylanilytica]|uniref:Extracellular solute-binding protein n=1 Tax=Cohnella xylanilytica TaxID=557555 RepID=A0A841TR98_9BACL|nr:extracellular solute-binding protein [Cohnella xylanilytica]MBB6690897.1 extracellular solute-binding protein [Cohnella xylanilytica]
MLVTGLSVALAGCGGGSDNGNASPSASSAGSSSASASASAPASSPASSDKKVTINMMHLWPEGSSAQQNKIVNQIIKEYQDEHPNVTIKQEVLENEQYKSKMKVLSASNKLPDVGMTWAAGYLQPFVEGNLFAPVDDLLQGELKDKFVSGTTEAYAINGKTYALPLEFNITPVYYNKKIFEKYNLKAPTTYAEFQEVVKTLTQNGVAPIALGNKDRWTGSLWYMYLADRIAGSQTLADAITGKVSFKDAGLVQAAKEVQTLVDENAFNKGFNGLSNDEGKSEFLNGKAAMYMMGTWELPNFTTNQDIPQEFRDSVGFFKFPTVDGGKGNIDSWVGGPGVGLFVAENSAVKEEAKSFVEYFVKRWGEQSVTDAGVIPATKVDTASIQLPQLYIDLLNEMNKATSITLFADVQMKASAAETHLNQIQALFGKAVTPDQFADEHDKAIAAGQ